jgi:hypothetical protein
VSVADPGSAGLECWSTYRGKASNEIKGRALCGGKLVRYEVDRKNLFPFGPVVGKHERQICKFILVDKREPLVIKTTCN